MGASSFLKPVTSLSQFALLFLEKMSLLTNWQSIQREYDEHKQPDSQRCPYMTDESNVAASETPILQQINRAIFGSDRVLNNVD